MTQLGEAVLVANIAIDKHKDDVCPFCAEDKPVDGQNKLDNDSSKLRTACKASDALNLPEPGSAAPGSPQWRVDYQNPQTGEEKNSAVRSNPHHLIPGRAALNGSFQHPLLEAIAKSKNVITADIGYDVNGRANGLWLPTIIEHFYAGYRNVDPVAGLSWGRLSKNYPAQQFSMAEAAMHLTKRQFHDAHADYSEHVKGRLDKLLSALILRKSQCPEAGPKAKPNVPPPYKLVSQLNSVSMSLASRLSGEPSKWVAPLYTSRHAEAFRDKLA